MTIDKIRREFSGKRSCSSNSKITKFRGRQDVHTVRRRGVKGIMKGEVQSSESSHTLPRKTRNKREGEKEKSQGGWGRERGRETSVSEWSKSSFIGKR